MNGTFLRWAGSKRKLLPKLRRLVPENFHRYVEPFAGSACLFFDLKPGAAILGDINAELMSTYSVVRNETERLIVRLSRARGNKIAYYRMRSHDPKALSSLERAARFIYLNRFCFNGLFRTNLDGRFNVPYGGLKSGSLPSAALFRDCAVALAKAELVTAKFEDTLELTRPGDFVYLDPPYCIRSRRVFNAYSHASFGPDQLMSLRQQLERLDRNKIKFLVSYGYSREALKLGVGFRCSHTVVQRQIAGFAAGRRRARELLITNL